MKDSNIQWTDHTWNVARGCTKVDEDCKFCYMYRDSMNNTRYNPLNVVRTKTVFNLPLKIKEPSKIFTSSLTDFFHEEIDSYRDEAWDIIRKCPHHTFQILTKRPERINFNLPPDWGKGWKNVWLGTSIGHPKGIRRLYHLLKAPALTRFLSLEPLHGSLSIQNHYGYRTFGPVCSSCSGNGYYSDNFKTPCPECNRSGINPSPIHWVIVGGESGNENGKFRYRECQIEWIKLLIQECRQAGVPVFVKQLGTHLAKQMKLKDRHGGDMNEWPEELRIREMPGILN
jgi:protein gp37